MRTLARLDPFQDMLSLREAMNQLLEESFVSPRMGSGQSGFVPAMDLSETADAYIVEASVPGLKAEDLNITIEDNVLTISGELREETERQERNYHRVERRFGHFERRVALPTTVKSDAINARLHDGILHLEIPKAEEVKPRRITVNVGNN